MNVIGRQWREFLLITVLLSCMAASGQTAAPHADANASAEAEVKSAISKMADMIVKADWDGYAQRLAPDYVGTAYDGHVENKEQVLARLRDPQRKIIVMEMEPDQRIRIYGDSAISSSEFTISDRESGHLKTRLIRFTDTWLKRDGQWYVISEHASTTGK